MQEDPFQPCILPMPSCLWATAPILELCHQRLLLLQPHLKRQVLSFRYHRFQRRQPLLSSRENIFNIAQHIGILPTLLRHLQERVMLFQLFLLPSHPLDMNTNVRRRICLRFQLLGQLYYIYLLRNLLVILYWKNV
jgi:hypothetical protein